MHFVNLNFFEKTVLWRIGHVLHFRDSKILLQSQHLLIFLITGLLWKKGNRVYFFIMWQKIEKPEPVLKFKRDAVCCHAKSSQNISPRWLDFASCTHLSLGLVIGICAHQISLVFQLFSMPCAADVCQNVTAIDFQTVLCILSLQLRKAVIGGLKWRDFSRKLSLQPTMWYGEKPGHHQPHWKVRSKCVIKVVNQCGWI